MILVGLVILLCWFSGMALVILLVFGGAFGDFAGFGDGFGGLRRHMLHTGRDLRSRRPNLAFRLLECVWFCVKFE